MITTPAIEYWRKAIAEESKKMHEAMDRGEPDLRHYTRNIMMMECNEIEQMIASLYPEEFPSYPGDWNTHDLCVGDHTHMSLLDKLIDEVLELRKIRDRHNQELCQG
jgi:hypothetical protein